MAIIPPFFWKSLACLHLLAISLLYSLVLAAGEVVVVVSADLPPYRQAQEALLKGLDDARRGRAFVLDQLSADASTLPTDAVCVVAIGTPAAVWLHARQLASPLIYCMVSDPAGAGLHHPPAATGVSTDVAIDDQLRLIADALPQARTIGVLYREHDERSRQLLDQARLILTTGWKLEAVAIDRHDSPAAAIDVLLGHSIDVIWTMPDTAMWTEATVRSLLLTSLRRRVPVFGFSTSFVRAGALFGVGLDPAVQGTQAGALVREVLAGKTPMTLAVPPLFDICLNLVVAQKLNVTLPAALIERAKHVFEPGR